MAVFDFIHSLRTQEHPGAQSSFIHSKSPVLQIQARCNAARLNISLKLANQTHTEAFAGLVLVHESLEPLGNISSKLPLDKVERITSNEFKSAVKETARPVSAIKIDSSISERKLNFSTEMDVRGERLNDAVEKVTRYVDDAIMLGISSVRIIHGKGTGVLRDELQKLIRTIPGVASVRDEHIQFGGTGVTIVTFD